MMEQIEFPHPVLQEAFFLTQGKLNAKINR